MRGEHSCIRIVIRSIMGSSPHARGTRARGISRVEYLGIIPACAGNTRTKILQTVHTRDHPRMRGEHSHLLRCQHSLSGSSPHARGTHRPEHSRIMVYGIIPACAGNTRWIGIMIEFVWDHPRMRGEHLTNGLTRPQSLGIIPACAGNTLRNPNNPNPNISLSIDFDSVYIICYQKLIQRL